MDLTGAGACFESAVATHGKAMGVEVGRGTELPSVVQGQTKNPVWGSGDEVECISAAIKAPL